MALSHQKTHQAGRHLAVAEALLRGYDARLETASSYIVVNGKKAQVQVAGKGAWMIADIDQYTGGTIEYAVLVDVKGGARAFYVCPAGELRAEVRERHEQWLVGHGGERPRNPDSRHTAIRPEHVVQWPDNWDALA